MADPPLCLACSVLRAECERLEESLPDFEWRFLDSMLHVRPADLRRRLAEELAGRAGRPTVLLYGDCHSHMEEQGEELGVARTPGVNCCEILLGADRYHALRRERAFLLMPEWTRRWREVFVRELGLGEAVARSMMGENHRVLVYLDTGVTQVPIDDLEAFGAYCGLPWRVEAVRLDLLREALTAARAVALAA